MSLYPVDSKLGDAVTVILGMRPALLGFQKLSDFTVVRVNVNETIREFRMGRRVELMKVTVADLYEVRI